jgi:hypothetical protein
MHSFSISGFSISLRNSENLGFLASANENLMEEESDTDSLNSSVTLVKQLDLVLAELEKNSKASSNNSIDVTTQSNLILDVIEDVSFIFLILHNFSMRPVELSMKLILTRQNYFTPLINTPSFLFPHSLTKYRFSRLY